MQLTQADCSWGSKICLAVTKSLLQNSRCLQQVSAEILKQSKSLECFGAVGPSPGHTSWVTGPSSYETMRNWALTWLVEAAPKWHLCVWNSLLGIFSKTLILDIHVSQPLKIISTVTVCLKMQHLGFFNNMEKVHARDLTTLPYRFIFPILLSHQL